MEINKILNQLTLEEKVLLLEGADRGFTNPIERLGIPRVLLVDGPHGARVVKGTNAEDGKPYTMNGEMEDTTALPCEAAMASAWNTDLIYQAGKLIGKECQQYGVGVLLGPGVNGKRSPLAGRNFEYYSEDPYVSGKMASAFINGLQSQGVGACMKHFAFNEQETRRTSVDTHVDERTAREIYIRPFEMAIKEAKPWCIMSSYNKVNGAYASESKELLVDLLREQLGFEGTVISDWNAVNNKNKSVKNGLDLQMPGPGGRMQEVINAVNNGEITQAELDARVLHVLQMVDKVLRHQEKVEVNREEHHKVAVQIAEEGIVLLKNEENVLPLQKNIKLAVVGEYAEKPMYAGAGSSTMKSEHLDIPLDSLRTYTDIRYAAGFHGNETNAEMLEDVKLVSQKADAVIVFVGSICAEGMDREHLRIPKVQEKVLQTVAEVNKNVILVTMCGSVVEYKDIEKHAKAILHTWNAGEGCGQAIANLLFGEACPSGKLTETFPVSLANTPAYQDFPGFKDDVYYREGLLVGYRYYDTKEIAPFYPFGHGLSYTTFSYTKLRLSTDILHNGDELIVSVDVTNAGDREGKEVIQIYVSDVKSYMFRPKKELKGFTKVALAPGETKTVEITLSEDAFSYYIPHLKKFAVETGEFLIEVGASVSDIRLTEQITFLSEDDVRLPLTKDDSFKDYLEDDRYSENAQSVFNTLRLEESSSFYQLLVGSSLHHTEDLLNYFDESHAIGSYITDCLVNRKRIELNKK